MFMRFVQLKLDAERFAEFRKLYDERVIPVLHATPGCLYASLIQSIGEAGECISMTIWDKQESADAYEQHGTYSVLLKGITAYLAESSEWKVQLSKDLTMEYERVTEEPVVQAYQVTTPQASRNVPEENALYVRIVSPVVREGMEAEFQKIYKESILPTLRMVKGCRYVYLTKSSGEANRFLSVTIWDRKQDAEEYERSGMFDKLTEELRPTLSDLYQWKMQLDRKPQKSGTTPVDLAVAGYTVVTGKSFI